VDYLLGLAKNERLKAEIAKEMGEAKAQYQQTGRAARLFQEFVYQTRESWSRARRVVAKAEHLEKGENPRFVVTSVSREAWPMQALYEDHYCARGDMENRIKEQLMLFSDRTSTHYLRSNQLRLYFSSIAYVLLQMLRRLGLEGTELAKAQCSTIRLKLLKIGALMRITVRHSGSQIQLYQNCTKTLSNCDLGAYFEREADSPKLLKTLKAQSKGWKAWNEGSCLQSRCSPS
jgi:hypothetical protein